MVAAIFFNQVSNYIIQFMKHTHFKFIYIFTQMRQSPGMCFCVYEVRTNTTEHGPFIPIVENFSSNSVQLSLTIASGLVENGMYSANIITTNTNGIEITVDTVEFSKSASYQKIIMHV